MIRIVLNKVFRKKPKNTHVKNTRNSLGLNSKECHTEQPHTATEKTLHQINKYRREQGMTPL